MTTRNDIRVALQDAYLNYTGGYFTYTSVNIKDYDMAGKRKEHYPIINIIALNEENLFSDSVGKQDNALRVVIEAIPYANEADAQEEIDKVISDCKTIILSNPQLNGVALDSVYQKSNIFALGTNIPALTVKMEFTISYRENRPLCNQ